MGWFFAPHWRVLGFIKGGHTKCRGCLKRERAGYVSREVCAGCDGFEAKTRKFYEGYVDDKGRTVNGDSYIVKCMGLRNTVFGTAFYQLNHAGVRVGVRRHHVATWWGVVSYHKLKVKKQDKEKHVCPICEHDLVQLRFVGDDSRVPWLMGIRKGFVDDLLVDGHEQWVECEDVKPWMKWCWKKGTSY